MLCMNEMADLLPVKCQGVFQMKSGRWGARIRHPITKARIWLGSYNSLEEASDVHSKKKLEFESLVPEVKKDKPSLEKNIARKIPGSVYRVKNGKGGWKWRAEIRTKKVRIYLGNHATTEEAKAALDRKRNELDSSMADDPQMNERRSELHVEAVEEEQSAAISKPLGVFRRKSGRWFAEIRNPITKMRSSVGTYETAEEAAEALKGKREEFGLMVKNAEVQHPVTKRKMAEGASVAVCTEKKYKLSSDEAHQKVSPSKDDEPIKGSPHDVYQRKLGRWYADMRGLIAKTKTSGGQSNSDECREIGVNDKNVETAKEDLYVGVIDGYGRLIGEFSNIDDELWLCRSLDDDDGLL